MGSCDLVQNLVAGLPVPATRANQKLENLSFLLYAAESLDGFQGYKAAWKAPWACKLLGVQFWVRDRGGVASEPQADLYQNGATLLTAPVSLLVDATFYAGVLAGAGAIAAGDVIAVWTDTNQAFTTYLYDLYVTLTLTTPDA